MRAEDRHRDTSRKQSDQNRLDESEAILRRIRQETDPQIGAHVSGMATGVVGHLFGRDADPADRIEVWGTRIGRLAGLFGFAALALLLAARIFAN